jgi:hypothetical protein
MSRPSRSIESSRLLGIARGCKAVEQVDPRRPGVERSRQSQITRHRTHYLHLIGPIPSRQWLSDVDWLSDKIAAEGGNRFSSLGYTPARGLRDTAVLLFLPSLPTSRLPPRPPSHKFIQTNSIITFSTTRLPLEPRFMRSIRQQRSKFFSHARDMRPAKVSRGIKSKYG